MSHESDVSDRKTFVPLILVFLLTLGCGDLQAGGAGAESQAPESQEPESQVPGTDSQVPGTGDRAGDPTTQDPQTVDPDFPAAMAEVAIQSHGSRLNGIIYLASGKGPHPTVVLLHGFPGNEKNLDLAQAVRRAGFNVAFFHYRGSWGSEGSFSFSAALEDVKAVKDFLKNPENAARYRINTHRISVVGHSMGGFMALHATALDPSMRCTVSIAGANLGLWGFSAKSDPAAADGVASALDGATGPLHGTSGVALRDELVTHADTFHLPTLATALKNNRLLLIGGQRDGVVPLEAHHQPLVAALDKAGAEHVDTEILDADHAFSDKRIALARAVVDWLGRFCG